MNSFLNSLSRCCDEYSQDADVEREKLRQIDEKYRDLDKMVKLQLLERKKQENRAPSRNHRPNTSKSTPQRAFGSKYRTSASRQIIKREPVIRPAPYPVRNYVLPAKPLINPQKYYNSHTKDAKKKEMQTLEEEYSKYPGAFEKNPLAKEGPSMEVTAAHLYATRKTFRSTIDMYFENVL